MNESQEIAISEEVTLPFVRNYFGEDSLRLHGGRDSNGRRICCKVRTPYGHWVEPKHPPLQVVSELQSDAHMLR